jgi:hypothetical protein
MVSKIRGLSVKVAKWVEKARKLFISGDKLSMQEGKALLDAGEKLRVNTQELRTLKSELRAAQGWSNRVKKCNLDYGSVHVTDVKQLIAEHDSLLIEFPQEVEELKLATVGYCICRRPYEGFMIGCDSCEVSLASGTYLESCSPPFPDVCLCSFFRSGIMVLASAFLSLGLISSKTLPAFAAQQKKFLSQVLQLLWHS